MEYTSDYGVSATPWIARRACTYENLSKQNVPLRTGGPAAL